MSFYEANDHGNQLIFSAPSTSHRRSRGGRNGDDPGTATHSIVQRRRGVRRGRPDCARRLGSEPDHRVAGTPGVAAVLIGLLLIRVSLRLTRRNHDFLVGKSVPLHEKERCGPISSRARSDRRW